MRRALPRPSRRLHSATERRYRNRARSVHRDALRLRQRGAIILRCEQASVRGRRNLGMFETGQDHVRLRFSPRSARNQSRSELTIKTIICLWLAVALASAAAISMTSSPRAARAEIVLIKTAPPKFLRPRLAACRDPSCSPANKSFREGSQPEANDLIQR
jgi:hypothetical protein